jgi:hypothetical protein
MKCPRCQSAIVIGFTDCVVCQKNMMSSEPISAKYFVVVCAVILGVMSLFQPTDDALNFFKVILMSSLVGGICGSVIWLFYDIFRPGNKK